jgi:hypothetical protein
VLIDRAAPPPTAERVRRISDGEWRDEVGGTLFRLATHHIEERTPDQPPG